MHRQSLCRLQPTASASSASGPDVNISRRPFRSAFTLVELLTVTAIISILASLLFWAFHSGLVQASRIKEIAQLQQLGLAFQSYAMDNNGLLATTTAASNNNNDYAGMLCPYLGYGNTWTTSNLSLSKTPIFFPAIYGSRTSPRPWIYIYNDRYIPRYNTAAPIRLALPRVQYDNNWTFIPMTEIPPSLECSALYLLRDSYMNYNSSYPASPIPGWPKHQAFYLFLDGHVSAHDYTDTNAAWTNFPH